MISLRPLRDDDQSNISQWPPYPDELRHLDYALRENGWIREFRPQAGSFLFAGEENGTLIGFTILCNSAATTAEFRIALRADCLGQGRGRILAHLTLQEGFTRLGLNEIQLIVRPDNARAIRLYHRLGFSHRSDCYRIIQGEEVAFYILELSRQAFMDQQPSRGTNHA